MKRDHRRTELGDQGAFLIYLHKDSDSYRTSPAGLRVWPTAMAVLSNETQGFIMTCREQSAEETRSASPLCQSWCLLLQSVRQCHAHPVASVNSTPCSSESMSHCINLLLKFALKCLGTLDLDGSASVTKPTLTCKPKSRSSLCPS